LDKTPRNLGIDRAVSVSHPPLISDAMQCSAMLLPTDAVTFSKKTGSKMPWPQTQFMFEKQSAKNQV
jgi:hypothetical protein